MYFLMVSHPSGVRELKLSNLIAVLANDLSHPSGVRELKLNSIIKHLRFYPRRTLQGCVN